MNASLAILVCAVASAIAVPLQDTLNARLFPVNKDVPAVSTETGIVAGNDATNQPAKRQSEKTDSETKESKSPSLATTRDDQNRAEVKTDVSLKQSNEVGQTKDKPSRKTRKHKAIFVNYPFAPQLPTFPNVPYDQYSNNNNFDTGDADPSGYEESNIFYIRLPPTPYMFVPGLGYISQPPAYSTANLRPHVSYARPARPKQPAYQQPIVNQFIKLPIDFVSNGKPTSVYQWQKKASKKPTDSPITNLDSLSAEFVSNGKPTSVHQWPSNSKPTRKPVNDFVNKLDNGPYVFNGKPTSFFLLKPDGTTGARQHFRYTDYRQDNPYY